MSETSEDSEIAENDIHQLFRNESVSWYQGNSDDAREHTHSDKS